MIKSQPIGVNGSGPSEVPRLVVPAASITRAPAGGQGREVDQGKYARTVAPTIPIMVRTYSQTALDPDTHEMTIKVRDTSTKRVLLAWPPTPLWEAVNVHAGLAGAVNRMV